MSLTSDPLCGSSKYEEISPPNVEDFCYITDNTYMKQEVCVLLLLAWFICEILQLDDPS